MRERLTDKLDSTCRAMTPSDLASSALVIAPHFDDETLGCGATIARKTLADAPLQIAFMTDGAASHDAEAHNTDLPTARRDEAHRAAHTLGVSADALSFADLPDGRLGEHHDSAVEVIAELLDHSGPRQLFIPHGADGHTDHVVTNEAARLAVQGNGSVEEIYEYPIWHWQQWPFVRLSAPWRRADWPSGSLHGDAWRRSVHRGFGLRFPRSVNRFFEIGDLLDSKSAALDCYESQMVRPDGQPDWPILSDVSDGDFVPQLLQKREYFMVTSVRGD